MNRPTRCTLKNNRFASALLVAALATTATAGCSKTSVVKQSGPPSGLSDMQTLTVSYDYSGVAVGKEEMSAQEWIDSRSKDEHRENFTQGQAKIDDTILAAMTKKMPGVAITEGEAAPGQLHATVRYMTWHEGLYAVVVSIPAKITVQVDFSIDGEVIDTIEVKAKAYKASPVKRVGRAGTRIGKAASKYVATSTSG